MCVVFLLGVKVESAALREFAAVADGPGRGVLLFPEICTMELQLLATGSPDLEVLSHVFHSLLGAVHANSRNAALLYDQVWLTTSSSLCYFKSVFVLLFPSNCALINVSDPLSWSSQGGVKTILSGFHNILSQRDPSFTGLLFFLACFCLMSHCRRLFLCDL